MTLLELLNASPAGTSLAQLCRDSGLCKSTAHGLLNTLVDLGYASTVGNEYSPGSRLHSFALVPIRTTETIRALFAPALQAFNEMCSRDCYLAIPSGTRSHLTLDGLDWAGRPLVTDIEVRGDAIRTSAIGKIFLAHDQNLTRRVRRNALLERQLEDELLQVTNAGFSLDTGASRHGLHCMAVPLRHRGVFMGALGMSGREENMDPQWMAMKAKQALRELGALLSLT